ncbi:hypothetical protein [Schleiferia thermophila]|jgi:hypothetical protein|uniref:hypothetical protein n=1 Tax=Schleiferia thermophila TaxID=884107 RepID=UPI000CB962E4|nr:hypothetical protein CEN47_11285 [Fischerella thermalis CCMEE 5319]
MRNTMKKAALFLLAALTIASCSKDDDDNNNGNQSTLEVLEGNLTTRTLTADKKYLLRGQVFVRNGQTLTIEPGTVIFGDRRTRGTLIIDRGGKIIANGTASRPIVMTSSVEEGLRDRGDWGGLVILGNAACNQIDPAVEGIDPPVFFGGNPGNTTSASTPNNTESSGELRYVRVEFAGIELSPNNETNSITMGGLGSGTVMEYCMVSFGGDDGFEWFGGTNNGKYLISFAMWDDDFDVDFGWSGNVQFGLAVRYPGYADQSGSNGFETDNGPNDNDVQPYTAGVFSNVTIVGPINSGSSVSNANFQHAIDARRRTALSIFNSFLTGFPRGLRFNQPSVMTNYQNGTGVLANNILIAASSSNRYLAGSGVSADSVRAYWEANNQTFVGINDSTHNHWGLNPNVFYGNRLPEQYSGATFTVQAGKPLLSGASFAHPKFNEPGRANFFDKNVTFRGGFGTTDWTAGWAEFNPINKKY